MFSATAFNVITMNNYNFLSWVIDNTKNLHSMLIGINVFAESLACVGCKLLRKTKRFSWCVHVL